MSKSKWIIGGTLLLCICFAGGVWLWEQSDTPPAQSSSPTTKSNPRKATTSAAQGAQGSSDAPATIGVPASSTIAQQPSGTAEAALPTSGNLGTITFKRAQITQAKLDADYEEQIARQRKAQTSSLPVVQIPQTVATGKVPDLPGLPDLGLPEGAKSVEPSRAATQTDQVIGIQGVDGKLSATIRSKGKLVTVRPGQTLAGGVVSSISRDGVSIRQGSAIRTLTFE